MKTPKNKLLAAVVIILIVVAVTIWYYGVFSIRPESTSNTQDTDSNQQVSTAKNTENNKYAQLQGDAFDEAFIADMLAHHEGAISMSEQAQAMTAHEEIRTLASDIMQSQSAEMMQMSEWQQAWGFEATNSGGHMSHGGGGADMSGDMVEMQNKLQNLTGEAYDKEFLKQMILHHEQAIEMSKYAENNAKRQEIKDLARNIIEAQTKEIEQMKQWQKLWGY